MSLVVAVIAVLSKYCLDCFGLATTTIADQVTVALDAM